MDFPSEQIDFIYILSLYDLLNITKFIEGKDLLNLCKVNWEFNIYFSQELFWRQKIALEFKKDAKRWRTKEKKHHPDTLLLSRKDQWPTANAEVLEDPWETKKALGGIVEPSWICVKLKSKEEWIPCLDCYWSDDLMKWRYKDLLINLSNKYCRHQSMLKLVLDNSRARMWHLESEGKRLHEGKRRNWNLLYRINVPIYAGITKEHLQGIEVLRQTWADRFRGVERDIFLALRQAQTGCPKLRYDRRLMNKYQRLVTRIGSLEECNAQLKTKLRKANYQLQLCGSKKTPMAYI